MITEYSDEIQNNMRSFYNSLSEKDRRRYAGIEAKKIGHGGIVYISLLLACDEKTTSKGIDELNDEQSMVQESIRREGAGRKSKIETYKNIDEIFLDVLREKTAGDPMDEKVKWTNLTRREISEEMRKKGIQVSRNIVKKLLKKHNYVKRKALKKKLLAQTKTGINNSTKSLDCAKNMKTALIR